MVAAVISELRGKSIILPAAGVIERTAIAGRARARTRAMNTLLSEISVSRVDNLEKPLVVDPAATMTQYAWLKSILTAQKADNIRVGKRDDTAGDVNARYGVDPGLGFYTHVSDQHGPYNVRVMSATSHEATYMLDGMMHHGTALKIGTHYTDTGGASYHVFILCAMLGFRFCPRLRNFPDRKLACIEPVSSYKDLQPLLGRRIKTEVIREHWPETLRLVASQQAGTVLPSAMLKRLAAFQRQNQLD
jgi:TnpA family transposase